MPLLLAQTLFQVMLKMLVLISVLLNSRKSRLVLPQIPNYDVPMWKKLDELVVHLSGSLQKTNRCQEILLKSYSCHGEREKKKGKIATS